MQTVDILGNDHTIVTIPQMLLFTLIIAMPVVLGFWWTIQSIINPQPTLLKRQKLLRLMMFIEAMALSALWLYVYFVFLK